MLYRISKELRHRVVHSMKRNLIENEPFLKFSLICFTLFVI